MSPLYKYPRTYHLPCSEGATSDDKILKDYSNFEDRYVIVTEKMDGENTSIYKDYIHARSLTSDHHKSQDWLRKWASNFQYKIPDGYRFCGENLYAKHSIEYTSLNNYFYLFSIWDEMNFCLSWDETIYHAKTFNIDTVPILWKGVFNQKRIEKLASELDTKNQEGFVVRISCGFFYDNFKYSIAKYVRKNHVTSDKNWKHQKIIPNQLKNEI